MFSFLFIKIGVMTNTKGSYPALNPSPLCAVSGKATFTLAHGIPAVGILSVLVIRVEGIERCAGDLTVPGWRLWYPSVSDLVLLIILKCICHSFNLFLEVLCTINPIICAILYINIFIRLLLN